MRWVLQTAPALIVGVALTVATALAAGLTQDAVGRWLAAAAEIKVTVEQAQGEQGLPPDPATAMAAYSRWAQRYEDIVAAHGFTAAGFGQTTQRVANAYMAERLGPQLAEQRRQLEQARDRIRNDSSLSAAQKEQLLQQMELIASQMTGVAQASEAEKAAIRPYLERLERLW